MSSTIKTAKIPGINATKNMSLNPSMGRSIKAITAPEIDPIPSIAL